MTTLPVAALLASMLVVAGCGGDGDDNGGPSPPSGRGATPRLQTDNGTQTEEDSRADRSTEQPEVLEEAESSKDSEESESSGSPAGSDRSEPRDAGGVRATLATFLDGMREEDGRKVCSTYTRQTRTLVGSAMATSCARGMQNAFRLIVPEGKQAAFAKVRVTRVTSSGNRATARLQVPKELLALPTLQFIARKGRLGLRRESGEWRVELLSLL